MNIFMVNNYYAPNAFGGAERSVQALAEALAALGNRVTVVSLAAKPDQSVADINGVRVHYVESGNFGAGFADPARTMVDRVLWHLSGEHLGRSTPAIEKIIDEVKPDVVHTFCMHGVSYQTWNLAKRRHIPVVQTLYDFYLICSRGVMFRKGKNCEGVCGVCNIMTVRRRFQTRQVDAIAGVSQFMVDRHLENGCFPNAQIARAIYDGTSAPDGEDTAGKPERPDKVLRIGFLGRLHLTKGVEVLLKSVSELSHDNWTLSIGGTGVDGYLESLRAQFPDPRITFLGWTKTGDLLREIDVVVVPSIWNEPLSRVAMEAYSFGVPVIASRRGGFPEAIDEGLTGWLFDPDHPNELTQRLEALAENPGQLRKMGPACVARAESQFGREHSAEGYLNLYRETIAKVSGQKWASS